MLKTTRPESEAELGERHGPTLNFLPVIKPNILNI